MTGVDRDFRRKLQRELHALRPHSNDETVVVASDWWLNPDMENMTWHEPKEKSIQRWVKQMAPDRPVWEKMEHIAMTATSWPLLLLRGMERLREAKKNAIKESKNRRRRTTDGIHRRNETEAARAARLRVRNAADERRRLARRAPAQAALENKAP